MGHPRPGTRRMITVHHLENSRSQRVLWLLEELALPYQLVRYARDPQTLLAPATLRAVHPLGKSPVLVDDGHTLAESGAILEYLVERYDTSHALSPTLLPVDSPERLNYRYWMHYAEGSAMPPLLLSLVFARIRAAKKPFFVRPVADGIVRRAMAGFVAPQLKLHLDWMEQSLARGVGWFAGERFTAADIQMSFPVEAAAVRGGLDRHPQLAAFLQRIHARPAYQRALAQGGPFALSAG
jgi:glutathione S-transferase